MSLERITEGAGNTAETGEGQWDPDVCPGRSRPSGGSARAALGVTALKGFRGVQVGNGASDPGREKGK